MSTSLLFTATSLWEGIQSLLSVTTTATGVPTAMRASATTKDTVHPTVRWHSTPAAEVVTADADRLYDYLYICLE
jgi:hypothetical protein